MEKMSTEQMSILKGLGAGFLIFGLAVMVFAIIVQWKIYAKANQPGWACIIPIYNAIIMLKIIGRPISWLLVYIGCITLYIAGFAMIMNGTAIGGILAAAGFISLMVIAIIDTNRLSKSFGKGTGFTVGLVLLGIIFQAILAFDDSTYIGPNGVGEAVNNDPNLLHN